MGMAPAEGDRRGCFLCGSPVVRSGFTLVDLLVTLSIMAIAAAITVPRFAGSIQRRALTNSAYKVAADCQRARAGAIDASCGVGVKFDAMSSQYLLEFDSGPKGGRTERLSIAEDPFGAVVVSVSGTVSGRVTFTGFGESASNATVILGRGTLRIPVTVAQAGGLATVGTMSTAVQSVGVVIGGVNVQVGGVGLGVDLDVGDQDR